MKTESLIPSSLEARIMLCGARSRISEEVAHRLSELLGNPIDWDHLLALSNRNGVLPLLYHSLRVSRQKAVPRDVVERLRDYYQSNSTRSYLMTEELKKILNLFEEKGIPCFPLRGPLLNEHIYGEGALREFADLDLCVKKCDAIKAREVLLPLGYHLPEIFTGAAEALYLGSEVEYTLPRTDGAFPVELHWELTQGAISGRFDHAGIWERLVPSSVSGCATRALSREDSLLHLCIHGSKHFWPKLMWICDVNEFLCTNEALDWSWMIKETRRMGNTRMFLLGLHLAGSLLEAPVPLHIQESIKADRQIRKFAREVLDGLLSLTYREPGFLQTQRLNLRLRERLRDRLYYFIFFATKPNPRDALAIPLPRSLHFLYYLVHPIRQIGDYVPLALRELRNRKKHSPENERTP